MAVQTDHSGAFRLSNTAGLQVEINTNGSLRRFECAAVSLALFMGSEIEGGPTNLYLRTGRGATGAAIGSPIEWTPLLGPRSATTFRADPSGRQLTGVGMWLGIEYSIVLQLVAGVPAWFWHLQLRNTASQPRQVDLTYAQDLALASYGAVRTNEYYVSQYIDHTPLQHPTRGLVLASRQNQAVEDRHPWSLIGSLRTGVSFATDALQFHGLASRAGGAPAGLLADLPGRRLQHEHSMVVIRDAPLLLEPQHELRAGFFGWYLGDHPEATSPGDAVRADQTLALPEAVPVVIDFGTAVDPGAAATPHAAAAHCLAAASGQRADVAPVAAAANLFSVAPLLQAVELEVEPLRARFAPPWRHEETDEQHRLLSFFYGADRHVVLRAKELRVLRPHGQLLRTGLHLTPDEAALTSTVWMSGVFHSMVTQGHVNINRFLSSVRSYLGLFRSHGQRAFVELSAAWHLLDVPSAFEMTPQMCRWIYQHAQGVIEVTAEARSDSPGLTLTIEVCSGAPVRFLIVHHVALDGDDGASAAVPCWRRDREGVVINPAAGTDLARRFPHGCFRIDPLEGTRIEHVGGDELLFVDGRSRRQPYLCILTAAGRRAGLSIQGGLIDAGGSGGSSSAPLRVPDAAALAPRLALQAPPGPLAQQAAGLAEIAPWFCQNALVHYLAPRGLEQYSGGGWGTRDVCQGPIELLLALGRPEPIRDVLLRVMGQQNSDGDWPQWFMFFERERDIRAADSHGDIVFWPLVVLAQYLTASGDAAILDEQVPFYDPRGPRVGERASVWEHAQRALSLIERRVIRSTMLAAYGHGDWNDSLQPADPHMREHLCSAWTVTLHVQMLRSLGTALRAAGRVEDAARCERWAQAVQRDFQRLLLVDGVLAGYALFEENGSPRHLLHPRDQTTGLHYSVLAMIHAILEDLFTPEQAQAHLRVIEAHLSAPDGARLFDRPMSYRGGPQRLFQRAESATFFGREIGLMYTHAHLRYAQALAHLGASERFFHALCQANPIGIRSIVPHATLRQANCYFSSSDAAFHDRYEAGAEYERVTRGGVAVDGGWRVYSSGAGIALSLILRRFLGISCEAHSVRVDPVMPSALDGLTAQLTLYGAPVEVTYRVGVRGSGVNAVLLNNAALPFTREANPYREGAAMIGSALARAHLGREHNRLRIDLG